MKVIKFIILDNFQYKIPTSSIITCPIYYSLVLDPNVSSTNIELVFCYKLTYDFTIFIYYVQLHKILEFCS